MSSVTISHHDIRRVAESLLPTLNTKSLDDRFWLVGTPGAFAGMDYTDTWNRYIHRSDSDYEHLMLCCAFEERQGCIINSGAFIMMMGYTRPLNFIRYLFH